MKINISLDDVQAQRAISRLITAGTDMTPVMRKIANLLAESTNETFDKEQDPTTGTPWKALSEVTRKRRGRDGPKLQVARNLINSILPDWDSTTAVVGTNVPYATTHQFGAKKGEFGRFSIIKTRQAVPIPWGDIPARPFLGVSTEDRTHIKDIVLKHIREQWA